MVKEMRESTQTNDNITPVSYEELLKETGAVIVSPITGSMMPFVRPNRDQAVFTRLEGTLRENDVALYRRDGEKNLIMHRVLARNGNEYLIRGDALACSETETVPADHILAVMSGIYRDDKYYACDGLKYKTLSFLWLKIARPFLLKYRFSCGLFWRGLRFVRRRIIYQHLGI